MKNTSLKRLAPVLIGVFFVFNICIATTTEDYSPPELKTEYGPDFPSLGSSGGSMLLGGVGACETQYETFETNNDDVDFYGASIWEAQTFTATSTYNICKMGLLSDIDIYPADLQIEIREIVSGSDPNGKEICSTTHDTSDWSSSTYAWDNEIEFSQECPILSGAQYGIILKVPTGNTTHRVHVKHLTSDGFAGGQRFRTADGGSSWTGYTRDIDFKLFGNEITATSSPATTTTSTWDLDLSNTDNILVLIFTVIWLFGIIYLFIFTFSIIYRL